MTMDPHVPRVIGDFKIRRELGRGGMGVVYLARQLSLVRDVALKMLDPTRIGPDTVLRFQREASLLGRLSHPNIVQVYVVGEQGAFHYLAMEYVEGTDLERVLARGAEGEGAELRNLPDLPDEFRADFTRASVKAARDVASALAAAHAHGIIHRDVKPSNILLAKDGSARLADFGLARDLAGASLTISGETLGTPYYMSPERYASADPVPASDVYAVGAVLYESVCGARPFDGASPERLMASILNEDPVPPRKRAPSISRDLETVILKCLEKDPELRYRDGGALLADLERLLAGEPVEASAASSVTRALRRVRRRKTSFLALVVASVAAVAMLSWGLWVWRSSVSEKADHREEAAEALDAMQLREAGFEFERAIAREDTETAKTLLDALLERWPTAEGMRFERAELALRDKRFADAAGDYDLLAAGSFDPPAASMGQRLVAAILSKPRHFPEVEDIAPPTTGRQAWYLSMLYQQRGERDIALRWNELAVEYEVAPLEAWYSLGATRYRQRDYDGAKEALTYYANDRRRGEVETYLGSIEWMLARYESALSHFENCTERRPSDYVAWTNVAAAHVGLATKGVLNGDNGVFQMHSEAARVALDRARALVPDFCLIGFNEAILRLLEGDPADAEHLFESALSGKGLTPERFQEMWIWFGRTLDWRGDHDGAVDHLRAGLDLDPSLTTNFFWCYSVADALISGGQLDEAAAHLDQALDGEFAGNAALQEIREQLRAQ